MTSFLGDSGEETYIYNLQVGLHAVKRCVQCRELLPVEQFGRYGEMLCSRCRMFHVAAARPSNA